MSISREVAIVGAGIAGLAHAWSAAERGYRVTLFERTNRASGASIRNFGMIWPIGQPAGELHHVSLRSRERWLQVAGAAGIWANPCGSIHLAHRDDEAAVLQEFVAQSAELGFECAWLSRDEVLNKSAAANPEELRGGLFSPTELCVNPREAVRELPAWLERQHNVQLEFGTTIANIDDGQVIASDGRSWRFDEAIVCSGADFQTLFPELFRESGLRVCKLQMLKTAVQPNEWRLGPHLTSGLTLRHYPTFECCATLKELKQRIAKETPELDRFGIHVMVSQNDAGEVILGDSHEYDAEIEPFNKSEIDELMLRELRKLVRLPDWTIAERWHGIYSKNPSAALFEAEPLPDVHVFTGLSGAGMTLSFGLAERFWRERDSV